MPLPPSYQQPYAPDHPVYKPIPAGVTIWEHSAAVMAARVGQVRIDTDGDSPPVFIGSPSDPLWTVTIAGEDFQVRAPENIAPGTGVDEPLVILDDSTQTEYRMWEAVVTPGPTYTVTCTNGGVGTYAQADGIVGRATSHGSHTGSGQSYMVGMIRPHEIAAGHIPHAIRAAATYIGGTFVSPADRTDQSGDVPGVPAERVPMGARVFLDASVDLDDPAIEAAINAAIPSSNPLSRQAAHIILKAIQEYGMALSDGAGAEHNLYFEGDQTANWQPILGDRNGFGSYNDIGRALEDAIPWDQMHVTLEMSEPDGLDTPAYGSTHTGGSEGLATASVAGVVGGVDQTYVLTIGHRDALTVSSITGGGLTWTSVVDLQATRGQSYSKVYVARGTPSSDPFTVDITLSGVAGAISAVVDRFSGVDLDDVITGSAANTNGISGAPDAGGIDNALPEINHTLPKNGAMIYTSAITRVGYSATDPTYTIGGTADNGVGGARIVTRSFYRESPYHYEFNDLIQHTASADTDWVINVLALPTHYDPPVVTSPEGGQVQIDATAPGGSIQEWVIRYKVGLGQSFSGISDGTELFRGAATAGEVLSTSVSGLPLGDYTFAVFYTLLNEDYLFQGTDDVTVADVTPPPGSEGPPPRTVVLEDFWRIGAIGNGRVMIRGEVITPDSVDDIEWRTTTAAGTSLWTSSGVDFSVEGPFWFWIDPPFIQGQEVQLEMRYKVGGDGIVFFTESFTWWWSTHLTVERFRDYYMPTWLRDSNLGDALYEMNAKQMADLYAFFEDIAFQFLPTYATWSLNEWERLLGLPTLPNISVSSRRALVVARRQIPLEGARTHLVNAIEQASQGGVPQLTDSYDDYTHVVRLPSLNDTILQSLEQLVLSLKPVGIDLQFADVTGFLAGINEAGDPV